LSRESEAQKELRQYYNERAPVYEEGYHRDEEVFQAEIVQIKKEVQNLFESRRVLEVACGTGVWTQVLAGVAEHVTATDISSAVLTEARRKKLDTRRVILIEADAYNLSSVSGSFDAGFAGFWFSHIPRDKIQEFLSEFHSRLGKNSFVFMVDNTFEEGRGGRLIRKPGTLDTFKLRALPDGSEHKVLKNYYNESLLRTIFSQISRNLTLHEGKWFWWLSYFIA